MFPPGSHGSIHCATTCPSARGSNGLPLPRLSADKPRAAASALLGSYTHQVRRPSRAAAYLAWLGRQPANTGPEPLGSVRPHLGRLAIFPARAC